jgi:hypothetical protein
VFLVLFSRIRRGVGKGEGEVFCIGRVEGDKEEK